MPRTFPFLIFWAIYWAALRPVSAECLSPLSAAPDWQGLGVFQQTIAHDEFTQLLARVYAPGVDLAPWFKIEPTQVRIAEGDGGWVILKFSGSSDAQVAPRYWRIPEHLPVDLSHPLFAFQISLAPLHHRGACA